MNTPPFNYLFIIRAPNLGESRRADYEKLHFEQRYPKQTAQIHTVDNAEQCSAQLEQILTREKKIGNLTIISRAQLDSQRQEAELVKLAGYLGTLITKIGADKEIASLRLATTENIGDDGESMTTPHLLKHKPVTNQARSALANLAKCRADSSAGHIIFKPDNWESPRCFDGLTDRHFKQALHS